MTDLLDFPLPVGDCPPGQATRAEWEAEHAAEFEDSPWAGIARHRQLGQQLRYELDESVVKNGTYRYGGRDIAEQMLRNGATLAEMAEVAQIPVDKVAALFVQTHDEIPGLLDWEAEARKRDWPSAAALAKRTGMGVSKCERLLILFNIPSPVAERRAAGGGLKYTPEQYAAIEAMAGEGYSTKEIAKHLSMPYQSTYRIIARNGWRTK